ncbi:MAG TPA: hypothetical protein VFV70_11380 [Hyphomonadaceae bacterium]|nr:hypothetical protein [Hyphomonadaceae bacterium]
MRLRFALCAAALLAACSPKSEAPVEEADSGSGAVAEKRMPLPDCSTVQTEDLGADGWKHPDCRLMLNDNSGLAVEARYSKAEDETTKVSVQVVAPGDVTLQKIEETMGNTFNQISVQDIDKDGKADLLLPLETGNVNTTWAAWRQQDDGKSFVRIGEPSGVEIVKTQSGYVAVPSRSSANEWDVAFFKLEGELTPVATATITAEGEVDKITGVTCVVADDGGLAAAGLDQAAAQAKFCAEPTVAEIFK